MCPPQAQKPVATYGQYPDSDDDQKGREDLDSVVGQTRKRKTYPGTSFSWDFIFDTKGQCTLHAFSRIVIPASCCVAYWGGKGSVVTRVEIRYPRFLLLLLLLLL